MYIKGTHSDSFKEAQWASCVDESENALGFFFYDMIGRLVFLRCLFDYGRSKHMNLFYIRILD